jgi:hypothetical protein
MLLRAAQLGKSFLFDKIDPELFVGICQTLRILNAVRNYKIALPLTFQQYEQMGKTVLLNRLILRRQYSIAIQICQYLQMSEAEGIPRVLTEWACYKIKHGVGKMDAEQLANEISTKLGTGSKVSYSSIALKAIECKQEKLAIRYIHKFDLHQVVFVLLDFCLISGYWISNTEHLNKFHCSSS